MGIIGYPIPMVRLWLSVRPTISALNYTEQACRPQIFGRSVNPILTRRGRLCPPNYYWHPRIFRPSYGPAEWMKNAIMQLLWQARMNNDYLKKRGSLWSTEGNNELNRLLLTLGKKYSLKCHQISSNETGIEKGLAKANHHITQPSRLYLSHQYFYW